MMKFYMYLILLFLLNFLNLNLLKIFFFNLSLLLFLMMFKNLNSYYMSIYYWLGMDKLSYSLMLLSIFMILIMYLISLNMKYKKMYSLLLSILLMSLLLSFNSLNYFLFYLFFEMSLIPTFILIMMFGYQPERLNASMYMMLYTLFASLPLLIIMFILFKIFNNLNYYFMYKLLLLNFNNLMFYFFMMFAFLIKLPMFMFHMWLPKAHVEAPVSGSVILAGVMLKLGGYGIIRSMNMMIKYCMMFNTYMLSLNLLGMIFLSILCLRQSDLKIIVAYSSVVHMSLMLSSLMTMYLYSKYSSLLMMLGHGFCSPALFIMVNIIYIRSKTRNIYMNKGLINIFPSLMFWWFMLCINNMASPISLNLISEIFIMMSLMNWINKIFIILMTCMFFSAMYNLFLFLMIYHNNYNNMFNSLINNKIIEFFYLFLLWLPLNILILKLEIFI